MRARPGWTGFNGCLLVSKTKTLLKMSLPFGVMAPRPGDDEGSLDNVRERFGVQDTGLTRYTCLILHRRGRGWPRTPTYLVSFRTESVAGLSLVRFRLVHTCPRALAGGS